MDGRYRPYPQYKDSGIEWLGEVPAHWDVRPLRRLAVSVKTGKTPAGARIAAFDNNGLEWYTPGDISDAIILGRSSRTLSLEGIKEVPVFPENTILLVGIGTIGKVGLAAQKCSSNQQIHGIICNNFLDPLFGTYYLKIAQGIIANWAKYTTLPIINQDEIKQLPFPLPPLPEQRAIAACLDRETARIDALIAKKRELIDLLRRQRTAVISHAVTKGLDPNVPIKDSGVEWLGEIPSHWDVRRLKFVASVTYSNVDKHAKEDEIPVRQCNYVDVYKNEHIINALEFMKVTANPDEIKRFGLRPGDIILTKDSEDWKDIAVPAFVSEPLDNVICGYHLALVRPDSTEVEANYLFRSFQAAAINYQLQIEATGITRYGLGKRALGDALVLLPPLPEQRAIAAYLDRETARIDRLVTEIEASIDLLQRHRAALISAAVTGKIDIREQQQLDEINALLGTPSRGG